MHHQAGRLVHHDDVIVLVQDVDGDVLGREGERRFRVRHFDDELLAEAHLVGRLDGGAVDEHMAIFGEARDGAP